jgi:hypothetical protein
LGSGLGDCVLRIGEIAEFEKRGEHTVSELREKMKAFIAAEGFVIGKYGGCTHSAGLPSVPDSVQVRPNYAPDGQASLLLVTPSTVQRWVISTPWNFGHWMPYAEAEDYSTQAELITLLRSMIDPPATAWEEEKP